MRVLFIGMLLISITCGQEYFREPEKIVSDSRNVGDRLGQYSVRYETDGGILQQEMGSRKYAGTVDETQLIQGSVQYNAPDGTPVAISWTADEYGTKFTGTHIPTPPPIPIEIAKALKWLEKQPSTTEESYDQPITERPTHHESRPITEKKFIKDPKFRNQFKQV